MGNENSKKRQMNKQRLNVQPMNTMLDFFTLRSFNTVKNYDEIPDSTFLITKVHLRITGAPGVGKSSLAYKYLYHNIHPSISSEDRKKCNFQNANIRVNNVELSLKFIFTDFAGENTMDLQRAGFHFVVYDITNRWSFLIAQQIIAILYYSTLSHYGFTKYIILIANKADLKAKAEVTDEEAIQFSKRYNVKFRKISTIYDSYDTISELFENQIHLYTSHRLGDIEEKKKKQFDYLTEQRSKAKKFGLVSTIGSTYYLDS